MFLLVGVAGVRTVLEGRSKEQRCLPGCHAPPSRHTVGLDICSVRCSPGRYTLTLVEFMPQNSTFATLTSNHTSSGRVVME